jgi:hypothetical protein
VVYCAEEGGFSNAKATTRTEATFGFWYISDVPRMPAQCPLSVAEDIAEIA